MCVTDWLLEKGQSLVLLVIPYFLYYKHVPFILFEHAFTHAYCKPPNVCDVLMFVVFAMVPNSRKLDIVNSHFQEWPCTSTRTSGKIQNCKSYMSRNGPNSKNANI